MISHSFRHQRRCSFAFGRLLLPKADGWRRESLDFPSDGPFFGSLLSSIPHRRRIRLPPLNTASEFLFLQYQDKILRYQFGLVRDIEDAHDLTQKTFMRAWEKLPTLKDKSLFLPWLYKIARNIVYDYWRSKKDGLLLPWDSLSEQQSIISISGPEEVIESGRNH